MATKELYDNNKENKTLTREQTRSARNYVAPAVDIMETDEGLTLLADMPGVSKENLHIGIEKGVLTIEGEVPSAQGEELYREFSLAAYYRQFQLPDEIDPDKARAEVKDGVLKLHLPKAEAAKPRRIEISAG
ncbi:Hsp20/alpha crystallin family protein [Desulfuromonas sp. AOP6]|uniref:Hsp20/alpha crystallin family protein n=1 Tax=Desulfuromonas sp. AOP6 TaxID=1566351 RepID=UPI00127EF74C|nr:Hsp20/alpha crystallin family protein [Desulfuromonas sp. AOP6]BCA80751.1 molecular chaperone [Desulfuromonas sp. AOP6]